MLCPNQASRHECKSRSGPLYRGSRHILKDIGLFTLGGRLRDTLAQRIDQELSGEIIGRLPLLIRDVLDYDPENEKRVRSIVTSYEERKSKGEGGKMKVYYDLNCILPQHSRRTMFPKSSVTDSYYCLTEDGFEQIMRSTRPSLMALARERRSDHSKARP